MQVGRGLSLSYVLVSAALVPLWLGSLASAGVYDRRIFGHGNEEYRRLLDGAIRAVAVIALVSFALKSDLARLVLFVMVPAATFLAAIAKHLLRNALLAARNRGYFHRSVVVVGYENSVAPFIRYLDTSRGAGMDVVAAYTGVSDASTDYLELPQVDGQGGEPRTVRLVGGGRSDLVAAIQAGLAEVIAVVNSAPLGPGGLRHLGWELEGLDVDLMVSPEATDVAGPRVRVLPVSGLAMLHVVEPKMSGAARLVKEVIERLLSGAVLLVLLPLLLIIGMAVKLISPGPMIFRQIRVGRGGREFVLYKLRTMVPDAEAKAADLLQVNEADGPLFKIRQDPRVTPLGRWLRRLSIDELPQLWNVVVGQMAIVGPRPPVPAEVAQYPVHVRRRLLVKPGLTGLWQISGRSELPWEEAVRLDLHYVDNWSLTQDLVILARTIKAVAQGRGAF